MSAVLETPVKWSEREIARALYNRVFHGKHLVVIPNCGWTGAECDLLVVRNDLRLMDIEIKISRADLKADAKKDKWVKRWEWRVDEPWIPHDLRPKPVPLTHPEKIWKHYYALPESIWTPELVDCINPCSGILLISDRMRVRAGMRIERHAKPNKDAGTISMEALCHISRLCTVRMWQSYGEIDEHNRRVSPQNSGGTTSVLGEHCEGSK